MGENRTVEWEGFFTTRNLGGLPTRSGGRTDPARCYRSASLRFVTGAGWAQARESGLQTIVDLRNPAEISTYAPAVPSGMTRLEVPLDDVEDIGFWQYIADEQLDGTPLYYRVFLDRKAERCTTVLKALVRAEGGVLFHCTSGRDRTGLVSLLLLALADVDPETIAADYALSTEAVLPLYRALGEDQTALLEAASARRRSTIREAVLATLDGLDVRDYLVRAGMAADEVDRLRIRLSR
ncbi:tyrosine-protein phosphatase [Amycolatopsis rubida]|uniref:Protein tyrosine/serine phosphatase n=1 Tax=Amycolatopsis rubida TaxID=112413 RepID=A0A1I5XXM4_9PSEU|nr:MULTISPECIES: tyrosine-protein phosphatase [Amycolatopsis]MYW97462.1 protein-tyrosine-phosphatase [Amycolatopsis rubida]NEC62447.1 tyrosine-protein phosphatase [Amycolatopsis rubida]OAP22233.1 Tyrosine-protein phosphatase precursor [Amycolatopsis sp. M39]SFQ36698.1 Protein tyrosine/serine phosphatase [Amycolatopsis rubida]